LKNKIKVFVSDLGNVLIPFDYNVPLKKINDRFPGLGDRFMQMYRIRYEDHRNFEKGIISEKNFISMLMKGSEFKFSEEEICRLYSEIFLVNTELVALLPEIKKRYKLVLLSNTNSIHQKYGWGGYDFLKYFDKLILSHEVRSVKPEEAIYRAVEEWSGESSESHFFIDDIPAYIEGAKKCGWSGTVYSNVPDLLNELKSKNIL
jgi:putative hydrolase of the HAD superfamily